jgi:hypothetical protein
MISHSNGLLASPPAPPVSSTAKDHDRERQQLRRELLRRILDREHRRRALRGSPR